MPSKRRLKQLRNAQLMAVEQTKKRKIEETPNYTAQPCIDDNQLSNDDTHDTDDSEGIDTWFWNSSANESCSDSEGRTERGEQSDEEKGVKVTQPRTDEAARLHNAVKEIKWNKEGENNLRIGYGKRSRSTNKGRKKATRELKK